MATQEEHYAYLDRLRESGETNMYGAGIYLERKFGMSVDKAADVLQAWMYSFETRHPPGAA